MKKILLSTLGISALAAIGHSATVGVVFNDPFGTSSSPTESNWYGGGTTVANFVSGGDVWLRLNDPSGEHSAGDHMFKQFTSPGALSDGQTLRLSFVLEQTESLTNSDRNLAISLFNTGSSYSADQSAANIWASGTQGYRALLPTGTNLGIGLQHINLASANTPWAGTSTANQIAANSNFGSSIVPAGTTPGVTITFDITRISATENRLSLSYGSTVVYNAISTAGLNADGSTATPDYFDFNTVAIGITNNVGVNARIRIDDVNLEVIPEPSTYAMLVGGLGLLAFMRRRKVS